MKYFLVDGERISEEELKKRKSVEVKENKSKYLKGDGSKKRVTYYKRPEDPRTLSWEKEKKTRDLTRRRKKVYNFIGNPALSKFKYIQKMRPIHQVRMTPARKRVLRNFMNKYKTWGVVRDKVDLFLIRGICYHVGLYKDSSDAEGATREFLYQKLQYLWERTKIRKNFNKGG